jgi:predicted Zn-dependent protease
MSKKRKVARTVGRRTPYQPVRLTPKNKAINPIVIGIVAFTMILVLVVTVLPGTTPAQSSTSTGSTGGSQQQTISNLEAIVRVDPKNVGALIQLGNTYYDTQQWGLAVERYTQALELDPQNTNVIVDLGTSYFSLNMMSQAESYFRKALEIDPTKPQAHLNLGNALANSEPPNIPEAIASWNKAIENARGDQQTIKLAQDMLNRYK